MNFAKKKPITLNKSSKPASSNKRLLILLIPVVSSLLIGGIGKINVSDDMALWQSLAPLLIVAVECIVLLLFIRHFNRQDKS